MRPPRWHLAGQGLGVALGVGEAETGAHIVDGHYPYGVRPRRRSTRCILCVRPGLNVRSRRQSSAASVPTIGGLLPLHPVSGDVGTDVGRRELAVSVWHPVPGSGSLWPTVKLPVASRLGNAAATAAVGLAGQRLLRYLSSSVNAHLHLEGLAHIGLDQECR